MNDPWTNEQRRTLEDYLDDYLVNDSDSSRNRHLKKIVPEILEHDSFKGKLGPEKTDKQWKSSIERYFRNARQTQRVKQLRQQAGNTTAANPAHDPVKCIKSMRAATKLFQVLGNKIIDGQNIFKTQNEARIRDHAGNMEGGQSGARFKKALKELWDAESDKASYETQAQKFWNVSENQLQFLSGASSILQALCEYKHLGKAELMLMYTFSREDGSFDSGCISGHSEASTTDFSDEHEAAYRAFLEEWAKYVPEQSLQKPKYSIPVDSRGLPCFPTLDLESVAIGELRGILSAYLNALWVFAGRHGPLPYTDFQRSPEVFFNTTLYQPPLLKDPGDTSVKGITITELAEWFSTHSTLSAPNHFEFRSADSTEQGPTLKKAGATGTSADAMGRPGEELDNDVGTRQSATTTGDATDQPGEERPDIPTPLPTADGTQGEDTQVGGAEEESIELTDTRGGEVEPSSQEGVTGVEEVEPTHTSRSKDEGVGILGQEGVTDDVVDGVGGVGNKRGKRGKAAAVTHTVVRRSTRTGPATNADADSLTKASLTVSASGSRHSTRKTVVTRGSNKESGAPSSRGRKRAAEDATVTKPVAKKSRKNKA
ncbi:hypothetical protein K435DRAFT_855264 [Dendrothele bispora CBS 962.96]|uniref:Uncharacterized protein n=1 Tax=Dendrothele bispora (strain CBS 962.96) TaxID=1314807 RepID=A0A4V4HGT5_DENBC|nr:hypothetical protein K435DRAFT_855264 [Dendrothele bispora CBS 962.96]